MTGPGTGGPRGRRVVITGLGPITASGIGKEAFWAGLRAERSPVATITRFDPSPFRTTVAAEIHDFDAADYMDGTRVRRLDRFAAFAVAAARMALEDGGLDPADVDGTRAAVQMGSALGGLAHAQDQMTRYLADGVRAVDVRLATTVFCGAASCQVAIEFGFTGPNSTNAMSCASGAIAIGDAWRLIRHGEADVALAGGVEAPLGPLSFGAFALIRAMTTRNDEPATACRPFDRTRDGFVMGEGAAVVLLESLDHARARGATIYGEVVGYGTTNDAYSMAAPRPDGARAADAMRAALASSGLPAEAVDYVNAHASSTPLNDGTETGAVKAVLGDHAHRIPVTGTKPYYGHPLGASGAIEAVVSALVLERGWIPPTLNLDQPDEACDLDHLPRSGRPADVRTILSNSFGFGGINASLVYQRVKDPS